MRSSIKIYKITKNKSEGSSLAIALFFFLACSLMCAGMLFLANSSARGVSKSYNYAQANPVVLPPTPTPTLIPSPKPTPDPAYQAEAVAIDTIYSNLNYDFGNAFIAAENGVATDLYNTPSNMTYEILSYIHSYYGDNDKVPVTNNEGIDSISVPFTYSINGIKVKVLVEMSGTNGSKKNNGLRFDYFKITVSAADNTAFTYSQELEYTVNNGKDGKFYFKWSGSGGKHFTINNKP